MPHLLATGPRPSRSRLTHWGLVVGTVVGWTACAPPSLRNAHSLDKGDLAIDLVGGLDQTAADAELVTLDNEMTVTSGPTFTDQMTGDIMLRFGFGRGFEGGLSLFGAQLKYSALDERRHPNAPLSIALNVQGGVHLLAGGLLMSRQLDLGGFRIRPVANVWYSQHRSKQVWNVPSPALNDELEVVNPGASNLYATLGDDGSLSGTLQITEIAIPVGIELPIALGDGWDVVPFAAYSRSIPLETAVYDFKCSGCLAGLEEVAVQRRAFVWAGVKFQPTLKRSTNGGTPPPSSAPEVLP